MIGKKNWLYGKTDDTRWFMHHAYLMSLALPSCWYCNFETCTIQCCVPFV